jgi:hypothetical protein
MHDQEPQTGTPDNGNTDGRSSVEQAKPSGIREITYKMPATRESAKATEATQADLNNVEAQTVMMKQSGAEHITADRVVMEQSGAKSIEAKSAQLDQSGVVALGSDNTVLMQSSAIQVVADEAHLSKSSAMIVSARQARIEDSNIFLFAGTADGEVKTAFTPVTAAALGAAFALVLAVASLAIRVATSRNE